MSSVSPGRALVSGLLFALSCIPAGAAVAASGFSVLEAALASVAPALNRQVLRMAVSAMECATANGSAPARRLAVIDYSLPSAVPRMWIFDLPSRSLLHKELVAHGRGSGDGEATRFSNVPGSFQSSLGLFRTRETYVGRNGYSLRMDGLEPGINDKAFERAIVIHGAPYVSSEMAAQTGRVGRSHGCPAVAAGVARQVIDNLKEGQFVFSYYPDEGWLAASRYLRCGGAQTIAGDPGAGES